MEMRSELTVPLIGADGRLEGILNLESPAVAAFSEQDSHLLQALATQASVTIGQARLLDALQEIAGRLLAQPCQDVLDRVAELARELLNASASAVWTLQGDQLLLQASAGFPQANESMPVEGTLTGQAIVSRRPVIVKRRAHRSAFQPARAGAGPWMGGRVDRAARGQRCRRAVGRLWRLQRRSPPGPFQRVGLG